MKIGKYLTAEKAPPIEFPDRKTCTWRILGSNGYEVGIVKWYPAWRKYCFYPANQTLFDQGCLRDLAAFLDRVKDERVPEVAR